ncbi:MAG: hypothetical protein ABIN58_11005 [candidate division WOR-3 bacterium]
MRHAAGMLLLIAFCLPQHALAFTDDEVRPIQARMQMLPPAERIAAWAELFVGTPYDTDPLGTYVRREVIVADDRVDCMYLTFRAMELALSATPDEAKKKALDLRFKTRGLLEGSRVVNYDERYQDGADMLDSGKYGHEITARLGRPTKIPAPPGRPEVELIPLETLRKALSRLETGDIIFFIKDPSRRESGEIVAHMGFVKVESAGQSEDRPPTPHVYLIHASGTKRRGGQVRKVLLDEYLSAAYHAGARVTRISPESFQSNPKN